MIVKDEGHLDEEGGVQAIRGKRVGGASTSMSPEQQTVGKRFPCKKSCNKSLRIGDKKRDET